MNKSYSKALIALFLFGCTRAAMALPEVWIPDGPILRYGFGGAFLGSYDPQPGTNVGPQLVVVGNEVWDPEGNRVQRYGFTGSYLGSYPAPAGSNSYTQGTIVVGNEVWSPEGNSVFRYDFGGNFLGSYPAGAANGNAFVNGMFVVPEPSVPIGLIAVASLVLARRRGRASPVRHS